MLIEYEQRSEGNVVYEFINPNEDEAKEQEVQQKGIGPVMINVTENDRVQQMRAYMGAVLQLKDASEIIPLIQPGAAMEYELTTSIKKLSVSDKPKMAVLSGHGEASIETMPQLRQQLNVLYAVESYSIPETEEIPKEYKAIAWVAPSDTIPRSDFAKLDNYLNNGGSIFVAYSNVKGNLQQGLLSQAPDIGITGWLSGKGVQIGSDFVIDAQCATVTVTQQQGYFRINSQKEFPYFPRVSDFADHPMTKGLDEVILAFATGIVPAGGDSSVTVTPVAYTSTLSGTVSLRPTWTSGKMERIRLWKRNAAAGCGRQRPGEWRRKNGRRWKWGFYGKR